MKYLSDYMEKAQSNLFKKTNTFFAFSEKQFKEQYTEGTKYVDLGGGMITPKEHAKEVSQKLQSIYKEAMAQDLKENGIQAVIERELNNYETYYTNDLEPVTEALKDYPEITQKDIIKVYKREWGKKYNY